MALHGWHHGAFVHWSSTPYGRQLIESNYIRQILNDVEKMSRSQVRTLIAKIKADDLEDKVIENLITNIRIRRRK